MKTCPHCSEAFDSDLRFCPRDGTALRASETTGVIAGATIAGRYEIVRELGKGGMGVVYLANHIQMERPCALKVLRSDLLVAQDAVARFHREARNASRISHPNVVAVHDFGESGDGTTYLAMEFVDGRSLESLLDEHGTLSPRRAARITWQIANGLNVAHDLRIVHRDLKPANIMLTRYRAWEDFVKVVDFGIAKAFGGTTTTASVTTTGQLVGTPMYMSPEQWSESDVDHRSDVFSLTMITVRMLSAKIPAIRSVALLSGRQLLDMIPDSGEWPEDLKEVLSRGLAPDPERRYGSAGEFATALVQVVTRWVPPTPGVREPWEERLTDAGARSTREPELQGTGAVPAPSPRRKPARRVLVSLGVLALAGVTAWAALPSGGAGDRGAPVRPESTQTIPPSGPKGPEAGQPEVASKAKAPQRTVGTENPTPAPPKAEAVRLTLADTLEFLRKTFDLDRPDPDSASRVVRLASDLLTRQLPDSARIELSYRLAIAQLFLGEEARACQVLREVRPTAVTRSYLARSIGSLIDRRCD